MTRQLAKGTVRPPGILGMHAGEGSFHVKVGFLTLDCPYFAAKLNANFPDNGPRHGLPTIQGAVMLADAANGAPLASWIPSRSRHCARRRPARWQRSTLRETRAQPR